MLTVQAADNRLQSRVTVANNSRVALSLGTTASTSSRVSSGIISSPENRITGVSGLILLISEAS